MTKIQIAEAYSTGSTSWADAVRQCRRWQNMTREEAVTFLRPLNPNKRPAKKGIAR